jgi:penicillin amidase
VYSANNQPDSLADGYYPGYYAAEHRAKRIVSLIESQPTWSAEKIRAMALDDVGPNLPKMVKHLFSDMEDPRTETGWQAKDTLLAWNGSHPYQATAPTIYYRLLYNTLRLAMEDELGYEDFDVLVNLYLMQNSLESLLGNRNSPWWDDLSTEDHLETRAEIVTHAFAQSIAQLEAQLGSDLNRWRWERVHYLEHPHPLGSVPPLDALFNVGPIPAPSGHEVINNIAFDLDSTGRYRATFGPSRRAVIDFADPEHSWTILPTGKLRAREQSALRRPGRNVRPGRVPHAVDEQTRNPQSSQRTLGVKTEKIKSHGRQTTQKILSPACGSTSF